IARPATVCGNRCARKRAGPLLVPVAGHHPAPTVLRCIDGGRRRRTDPAFPAPRRAGLPVMDTTFGKEVVAGAAPTPAPQDFAANDDYSYDDTRQAFRVPLEFESFVSHSLELPLPG